MSVGLLFLYFLPMQILNHGIKALGLTILHTFFLYFFFSLRTIDSKLIKIGLHACDWG
jgi:hypothetical protein